MDFGYLARDLATFAGFLVLVTRAYMLTSVFLGADKVDKTTLLDSANCAFLGVSYPTSEWIELQMKWWP